MAVIDTITTLAGLGWSQRRIARELGINRETVGGYVRRERDKAAKPAISTTGSPGAESPPEGAGPAAMATAGWAGRQSACAAWAGLIEEKLAAGLTARRIHQDLAGEAGFAGSYESVKRFVQGLKRSAPRRVWRMEVPPGEEAQVDFGRGAPVFDAEGKRRQTHILRVQLSYSRKAYCEAAYRQTTESFLRVLENAFREFGGVPQTVCLDNLKAAVAQADWYEPELNPKVRAFAEHYGTVFLPCRPYCPQHKGKVERDIGYVKSNALKGRKFAGLREENEHLRHWEQNVADKRIHGATRQQVAALFEHYEKPALRPLPPALFPCFEEGRRTVHRDGYVEVRHAYYEAPEEYIGRQLWARWDSRTVRLYNQRMEQVRIYARLEPGKFTDPLGRQGCRAGVDNSLIWWRRKAHETGLACGAWAEAVIGQRGETALRVVQGLVALRRNRASTQINRACALALERGTYRLRDLKRLLGRHDGQKTFTFLQEHPLIRDLREYGQLAPWHHFNPTTAMETITHE